MFDHSLYPHLLNFEQFEEKYGHDFLPKWKPPFVSKFNALFLSDLDAPGPEHSFLIDDWLTSGDMSVVGGPSGSGKSFLAIHAGMCVATGTPFFDKDVEQGLVIYQAGEGARGVKKRLRAWRKHHKVEFSRETPFVLLQSAIDLWRPEGDTAKLIEEIKAICDLYNQPLRMVVIDTLATATGGADENSGKDMGLVMQNVAKIREATRAHVMLVHHLNAAGTKLRGHTSVFAAIDQAVLVTRNEATKVRTAKLDKQKDEESGLHLQFELMSVNLGQDAKGKAVTSCVCLPLGQKEAIRQEEEAKGYWLKDSEVHFMKVLFDCETTFGLPVPQEMSLPSAVRTIVPWDEFKRQFAQNSPDDSILAADATDEQIKESQKRNREKIKKRVATAREYLMRANIIGIDAKGDFVWWTGRSLRAFPNTQPARSPPRNEAQGDHYDMSDIPF